MAQTLKIVICGKEKVGKTSAWHMWIYGRTLERGPYHMHDDKSKTVEIDGMRFNCELNEINMESNFQAMNDLYLRESDAVLILYSVTDQPSYDTVEVIKKRVERIKEEYPKPNNNNSIKIPTQMLIWENKTDLEKERVISVDRGEELAATLKLPIIRGSARDKDQTEQIFNRLIQLCIEARQNSTNNNNNNNKKSHRECTIM